MKTWSTMEDYFRALERCLDCPGEDRERFLAQARRMADDFVQGKPDATPDEVAGCLGEPEELAQCFWRNWTRSCWSAGKGGGSGQTNLAGVVAAAMILLLVWVVKLEPGDAGAPEKLAWLKKGEGPDES